MNEKNIMRFHDKTVFTCTENERKFLDEIREKGFYDVNYEAITVEAKTEIWQEDFISNLEELT